MRCFIFLVVFLARLVGGAQHVDDDSAYYTPIPLPGHEKEFKKGNTKDSSFQDTKPTYFFSLNVGSIFGCDCRDAGGVSATFMAANGLAFNRIRTGAGLGFDSYVGWNTVPVTGLVSWDLWGNRYTNAFFVQLNYGYSMAWVPNLFQEYGFDRAQGGRMFSPQAGYRLKYHDINISVQTGFKFQRVFTYYKYPSWQWVDSVYVPTTNSTRVEENISRFTISVAVGWK